MIYRVRRPGHRDHLFSHIHGVLYILEFQVPPKQYAYAWGRMLNDMQKLVLNGAATLRRERLKMVYTEFDARGILKSLVVM